jgi:hypothetical protein
MVYIILLNWKGWRDTIECLESVFRLYYAAFRVIVCDNASEDNSLDRIARRRFQLHDSMRELSALTQKYLLMSDRPQHQGPKNRRKQCLPCLPNSYMDINPRQTEPI